MKKAHIAILQAISQSIPEELKSKLLKTVKVSPAWEKDVKDFLETGKTKNKLIVERFTDKKEQLQHMYDAGMFSRTMEVTDPKVEKEIGEYLTKKIDQAIKDGILPPRTEKLLKKAKQHGKRVHRKQNKADRGVDSK